MHFAYNGAFTLVRHVLFVCLPKVALSLRLSSRVLKMISLISLYFYLHPSKSERTLLLCSRNRYGHLPGRVLLQGALLLFGVNTDLSDDCILLSKSTETTVMTLLRDSVYQICFNVLAARSCLYTFTKKIFKNAQLLYSQSLLF